MKYLVTYESGATGFGWEEECNNISEVKYTIEELRHKHTALVTVWDKQWGDYIYYKRALDANPTVDYIYNDHSDLRTCDKLVKIKHREL